MTELLRPFAPRFLGAFMLEQRNYFIECIDWRLADTTESGRKKTVRELADDILEEAPRTTDIAGMKNFAERLDRVVAAYFGSLDDEIKSMLETIKHIDTILEALERNDKPEIAKLFAVEAESWRSTAKRVEMLSSFGKLDLHGQFSRAAEFFDVISRDYDAR